MATAFNTYDRIIKYYNKESPYKVDELLQDKSFSDDEMKAILSLYPKMSKWSCIWRLMLETGMRPIECVNLHIENFDFDKRLINFKVYKPRKQVKNGVYLRCYKCRVMPLSESTCKVTLDYIECNKYSFKHGFIFPGQRRDSITMNSLSLNMEFTKFIRPRLRGRFLQKDHNGTHYLSPKSFRITLITRLMQDLSVYEVCKIMNHTKPDTTLRYGAPIPLDHVRNKTKEIYGTVINKTQYLPPGQTTLK